MMVVVIAGICGVLSLARGEAQESQPAPLTPQASKVFSRVVIADIPPVLSASFELLAARFSALIGATATPLWWRLDMAAFELSTPQPADKVAGNLHLAVISDVSDTLILAPAETPQAIKAEARLFIMSLFGDGHKGVWKRAANITEGSDGGGSSMSSFGVGAVRMVVRHGRGWRDGSKPEAILGTDKLSLEGPLNDPKVMAALRLDEAQLKRPMKHYTISDFGVRPAATSADDAEKAYVEIDMLFGPHHEDGEHTAGGIVLYARDGTAQNKIPRGPECDLGLDGSSGGFVSKSMMGLVGMWWGWGWGWGQNQWFEYDHYREYMRSDKDDDPYFVAQRLDDFQAMSRPDAQRVKALEDAIKALGDAKDTTQERDQLTLDLVSERDFGYVARRKIWVDKTATRLMVDEPDENANVRVAKRVLSQRVADMIKAFADRSGANASYAEGSLNDWNLRQKYGLNKSWEYFDVYPYESSMLMLASYKGTDATLKGQMLLSTTSNVSTSLAFELRIHPSTGNVIWTRGEPESEEFIRDRHNEVLSGVNHLHTALLKRLEAGERVELSSLDEAWRQDVFAAAAFVPQYTTVGDYAVRQVLPGTVRVSGESADSSARQSALVDLETRAVIWETRQELPKAQHVQPMFEFDED